jgi:hypothetical protein
MYESLMTTAFVTIVAGFDTGTVEYAFGGVGLVAFVHAPIVRISYKIRKMMKTEKIKWKPSDPVSWWRWIVSPLKIAVMKIIDEEPEGVFKGEWDTEDAAAAAFHGGYSELIDYYDNRNYLFFAWIFFEQFTRVIILTVVPGEAQLVLLALVAFTSLVLLVVRRPFREINMYYVEVYRKATEVASFALLMLAAFDVDVTQSLDDSVQTLLSPCPYGLFNLVFLINQVALFVLTALSIYDCLCQIKPYYKTWRAERRLRRANRSTRARWVPRFSTIPSNKAPSTTEVAEVEVVTT